MNTRIIQGPWMNYPTPPRMSMQQFREHVSGYVQNIVRFDDPLLEIADVITHTSGSIYFSYSRKVATILAPLREKLRDFCSFLEDTGCLPAVLTALHYGFLSPLFFIEEQIALFTKLLEELCSAYILQPQATPLLYQRLYMTLTTLIDRVQQLPTTMNVLLDQASFHNKQFITIAKEIFS